MLLDFNFDFNEVYDIRVLDFKKYTDSGGLILAACRDAEDVKSPVYLIVLHQRDLFVPLRSIKSRGTADPREWTKVYLVGRCISVWIESSLLRINSCVLTEDF